MKHNLDGRSLTLRSVSVGDHEALSALLGRSDNPRLAADQLDAIVTLGKSGHANIALDDQGAGVAIAVYSGKDHKRPPLAVSVADGWSGAGWALATCWPWKEYAAIVSLPGSTLRWTEGVGETGPPGLVLMPDVGEPADAPLPLCGLLWALGVGSIVAPPPYVARDEHVVQAFARHAGALVGQPGQATIVAAGTAGVAAAHDALVASEPLFARTVVVPGRRGPSAIDLPPDVAVPPTPSSVLLVEDGRVANALPLSTGGLPSPESLAHALDVLGVLPRSGVA